MRGVYELNTDAIPTTSRFRYDAGMKLDCGIIAENAGLFVCNGALATHAERRLKSHELIFVRRGMLVMGEEGKAFQLVPGDTLLLQAGRTHKGLAPYPADLAFYWIHFRLRAGQSLSGFPRHATPARGERLSELLHRFIDDQEAKQLTPTRAGLLIGLMLCELKEQQQTESVSDSVLAARVEAYIDTHFAKPIGTHTISQHLGYNADYLGRIVRRDRQKTILELLHRRRLREARTLLRETTLSIKQIAQRCGFNHPVFLRQLFARHEGMSPREYRKLYARLHVNVR
jgi:AraC-like DNA-binding protein